MNKPAIRALNLEDKALRSLKMNLRILGAAAASPIPGGLRTKLPTTDKGRPPEERPARVALQLARYFHDLTGDKPTKSEDGPFRALIEDVFEALGMGASAKHYGDMAVDNYVAKKIGHEPT
jgi:hypothetical protein